MPYQKEAPRGLTYVVPKKTPEAEKLVARMMLVLAERRRVVEEMLDVMEAAGRLEDVYAYFGEEPPKEAAPETKQVGLLKNL
jgi:hypothetical protein